MQALGLLKDKFKELNRTIPPNRTNVGKPV
jgi:hypothetical protein